MTAIAGGKLAQRRVRSVAVSLEKLALDKPSVKLKQGESVTLTATLTPDPVHRDSGELDNEQCGAGRDERPDDRRRKRKGREHAGSPEGRQLHHYCCRPEERAPCAASRWKRMDRAAGMNLPS